MSYLTIFLFFLYSYGLGFTATSFVKNSENFLERNLMRIGIGFSLITFVGLVLNLFRIPIDWRIILAISLIYPLIYLIRNFAKFNINKFSQLKITKADLYIIVMLLIFAATAYIYISGAFSYPFLEDDDPWTHSIGTKYVAIEKTVFNGEHIRYIDPYPPTYDMLMGILHQTSASIYWTLKFFNGLIISLSIIFFYFFVKEFTNNRNKALFATFALASIPAFLSHFIWAISLTMPLFFVSFYAFERIKHDKKWWIVAALVMVTTLTSSPTHSTYFGLFLVLYLVTKIILEKKILISHILAGFSGLLLSFFVWWLPSILKYGPRGILTKFGIQGESVFRITGTADRAYSIKDFFIAQKQNMINNPIGIGIFLSLLTIISLFFLFMSYKKLLNKENQWIVITLVWFAFTLYAVNASNFTIKLSPFRAWMLLAIPVSILAAQGAFNILILSKKSIGKIGMYIVLLILIGGIYYTSAQQKIAVNTAQWPPGGFWTSTEEIGGYLWMRDNLPPNTPVFTFTNNAPILGMDMFICHWCEDLRAFQKDGFNKSIDETTNFLKSNGYQYVAIDGQTARQFGNDATNAKVNAMASSNKYEAVFNQPGMLLLKII